MIARIPNTHGALSIEAVADANPGWKAEREADGSFTLRAMTTMHGLHDVQVIDAVQAWQKRAGGTLLGSNAGFTMPDSAILSPDLSWISAGRLTALTEDEKLGYAPIVPDVCIEVTARPDDANHLISRLRRYRDYGATYVLLIDPLKRTTWSDGELPAGFPTDFTSVFDAGNT